MRIIVFCYEYPPIGGGAGNALSYLARAWARSGHQVTVVTSHFQGLSQDEVSDGVRIVRLRVGRKKVERGHVSEMVRFMIRSSRISEKIYKFAKPDLSVAFMTLPSAVAASRLKKKHQLPFVTELRGGDVPGFLPGMLGLFHWVTRPWIRSIWRTSSLVIANSEGLADLAKKTDPGVNIRTLPNGVDTGIFRPGTIRVAGTAVCRCIFVGRIVDGHKNISQLIRTVLQSPNVELVIVGAGPDESRLRQIAAAAGSDRVYFKGWLKGDALIRELQSSDVYVSASSWEGMSNSALEAMACGLPLILSRIPGHQELVIEGGNGFLFDSVQELKDVLMRIAADPDWRIRLGRASRDRAVQFFDWDELAARHLELYRKAIVA